MSDAIQTRLQRQEAIRTEFASEDFSNIVNNIKNINFVSKNFLTDTTKYLDMLFLSSWVQAAIASNDELIQEEKEIAQLWKSTANKVTWYFFVKVLAIMLFLFLILGVYTGIIQELVDYTIQSSYNSSKIREIKNFAYNSSLFVLLAFLSLPIFAILNVNSLFKKWLRKNNLPSKTFDDYTGNLLFQLVLYYFLGLTFLPLINKFYALMP